MAGLCLQAIQVVTICVVVCAMTPSADCLKRKLQTTFWPNCKDYQDNCTVAKDLGLNVVYTKASTKTHDNLHYVFSTIGVPVVSIVRTTGADADLHFDWDGLTRAGIKNSISFPKTKGLKVEYKYAVAFTSLVQYNDTHDDANLNSKDLPPGPKFWDIQDFRDFFWDSLPASSNGKDEFVFNSTSNFQPAPESNNGSLSFSFKVQEADGRASELPSLPFTANETLFDFVMANYTPVFKQARFALETVLVSSSNNKKMAIDTTESIDDEYSPGVFKINNLLSDPSSQHTTGFMQWKPVSYLSTDKVRKSATKVKHYPIIDIKGWEHQQEQVGQSVVPAIFGDVWGNKDVLVRATNISFGFAKDGFYVKNNYTAWSAAVGYGTPPADAISTTVIIIISAGLGIPVLIIIFGGIYTCIRRARNSSGYQAIGSVDRGAPQVN